jgi:DNA repair protein RadD
MKLRDYQDAAIASIWKYFEENPTPGNPLVALPTGTGKSPVIGAFIKQAYQEYPGTRIIKLTHVKELIQQNFRHLLQLWPTAPAGIFSAGLGRRDTKYPITYAGIASAFRYPDLFGKLDLILIDEAHLVSPKEGTMYQKFIIAARAINPKVKVIGFTATQYRLGQGLLTEEDGVFTDICFDMTGVEAFNWFISQGYLVPLIPKATHTEYNLDKVKIHAGEYIQKDLQEAVDINEVTYEILKEAIWLASDRQHWLVFASGVDHALHVTDMLEQLGVSATCIHSKMPDEKRDQNLADFKAGKYRVMVNNNILTTGFDYPGIDCICMLRPTQSPGLWVQMLGRGTRPVWAEGGYDLETLQGRLDSIKASKKQNCLVLDFAGNTRRLGPINDPRIPRRKGAGGDGEAPVKICPNCGVYNHAALRYCFNCGFEFPKEVKIGAGASTQKLIEDGSLQVITYDVDRITYQNHSKNDRPDSIKVNYYCGYRLFQEWVCLDHVGYARKKARDWWRMRTKFPENPIPESTAEGLFRLQELKEPSRIRVWINKDFPQIMGHEYD